jgi:hypothetical protein
MTTIGEAISRVRNLIKAVTMDAFVTDRVIYSLIQKYAKMYIKRESNIASRARFGSLFKRLPCVRLIEVDKVEACCDVKSGCTIMRTEEKLPGIIEGPQGVLLRSVSSIDNSIEVYRTTPALYNGMTKTSAFKYNKNKYYWYMNGYLYIPGIEWDAISIEGIFDSDLSGYSCDDPCAQVQDQAINIPPELFAEIEQQVVNDFMKSAQMPQDSFISDKQSVLR